MPSHQVAVASLRRGGELIHIYSESLALQLLSPIQMEATPEHDHSSVRNPTSKGHGEACLLQKAQMAAGSILDTIVKTFPSLDGQAVTSLSTALRVRQVRNTHTSRCVRGIALDRWLGYLANAADAGRNLTSSIIDEVVEEFSCAISAEAPQPADSGHIVQHSDPLVASDPWALARRSSNAAKDTVKDTVKGKDKKLEKAKDKKMDPALPDPLSMLTGSWESVDNPALEVYRLPIGSFVAFEDPPDELTRLTCVEGIAMINDYTLRTITSDKACWTRRKSESLPEEEIVWTRRTPGGVRRPMR